MSAVATSAILPGALLWSAEDPYLYTLVVTKGGDMRAKRIGFKEQRIDGNRILVNGMPVKFKGVNRHETSPENGRTVTLDDMMRDIALMKQYNVNTVRTCHYPDHRLWYDLCDRYEIYLAAEANVEGHGMGYGDEGLGLHAEWKDSIVERNIRQVLTLRNSPSVTIWSMGNETRHGDNFRAAIAAVKALDPTRPIHWERGNIDADVDSTMYPSVEWLDKRGKLGDGGAPAGPHEGVRGPLARRRAACLLRGRQLRPCQARHRRPARRTGVAIRRVSQSDERLNLQGVASLRDAT